MEKEKAQAAEQAKVNVVHLTFLQRRHRFQRQYGRLSENLFQLRLTLCLSGTEHWDAPILVSD